MKITKESCKKQHEVVTEIFGKKKKTKKENKEEVDIKIMCPKKINKN